MYYRGKNKITNGTCSVSLPEYTKLIATEFTVQVSPIGKHIVSKLGVLPVLDGTFTVISEEDTEFHWNVYGKRRSIEVEPEKVSPPEGPRSGKILHRGPYTYISSLLPK